MESLNNFSISPGNLISNHSTFSITEKEIWCSTVYSVMFCVIGLQCPQKRKLASWSINHWRKRRQKIARMAYLHEIGSISVHVVAITMNDWISK
jgi:hypothetical protein